MTQKDICLKEQELEILKEKYLKEQKTKFIGKNFLNALGDIAKTEKIIDVIRYNVSYITHYHHTKKISKNHSRENTITFPITDEKRYKDFDAIIKDVKLTRVITDDCSLLKNEQIGFVIGLRFILDGKELIIEE